jgi:two-component system OmpR family response regulator
LRILLVEDDTALAGAVRSYLESKAFVVDVAPSLADARAALLGAQYAAVLLDLHLGDGEGLSLLPHVRALADRPIVIVVTARDQVTDRIRGLDAGADDYIVKPYDPGELLARLRAVERRLLRVMASRPDRIHTRDLLQDALYGWDEEADSNTLEVFISRLRRKLGRGHIVTLRGLGYRLSPSDDED